MKNNPFIRLWGKPLLIALLSLAGLIAALVGDGVWDVFSWIALALPVIIIIRRYYFQRNEG
ncbi:hypothetical protein [Chitinophaga sp.]|uniref:hypothetical protein n=1 Tax=Chitinophaga sp. TaxID=1869181 RepID=UPI002BE14A16|nr:hypothetical protein [Chitinophaga sp.]HWV65661.1 hypothetical protein [Chitinophaga sp.]